MADSPWIALTGVVLGAVISVFSEPAKQWMLHRSERKRAKREMYDDLAEYVALLQNAWEGSYADYKWIRNDNPDMPMIRWYRDNRMDLLLWADKNRGLRSIYNLFCSDPAPYPTTIDINGRLDLIEKLKKNKLLDGDYLQGRVRFAKELLASVHEDKLRTG
jgi:hypothetical protein